MSVIHAVVFVPHVADIARYAMVCMEHCTARGYELVGVVTGDWAAAVAMLFDHTAGVLVVARAEHVQQLEPRIEVVSQEPERRPPGRRNAAPGQRRSQLIRRDEG